MDVKRPVDDEQRMISTALRLRGIYRERGVAPMTTLLPVMAFTSVHDAVIKAYREWGRQKSMTETQRRQLGGDRFTTLTEYLEVHFPNAGIPVGAVSKDYGKYRRQAEGWTYACGYYAGCLGPPGTLSHIGSIVQVIDVVERRTCQRRGDRYHYDLDRSADRLSIESFECLEARAAEVVNDRDLFLKIVHLADYDQQRAYPPDTTAPNRRTRRVFSRQEVEHAEAEARSLLRRRLGDTVIGDHYPYPPSEGQR